MLDKTQTAAPPWSQTITWVACMAGGDVDTIVVGIVVIGGTVTCATRTPTWDSPGVGYYTQKGDDFS